MRLGLKTFLTALLAAALVVPGAVAKPGGKGGGGNGGGHGKPAWAGGGGSSGDHGKPAWAGSGKGAAKKAQKAAKKAEKAEKAEKANAEKAEREKRGKPDLANLDQLTVEDLQGLNPAWTCKVERAFFGESEGFAEAYATNENGANAFGMCVSEEAQERDGVSEEAVEQFCEPADEEEGAGAENGTGGDAALASEGEEPAEEGAAEDGVCPVEDAEDAEEAESEASEDGDDSEDDEGSGDEEETEDDGSSEEALVVAFLRSLF